MDELPAPAPPGVTEFPVGPSAPSGAEIPSEKDFGTAVSLSAVFGFLGIQHFYLGRWGECLLDLGLSLGWIYSFASGRPILGMLFLIADFGHALAVTIQLFTGNYRDGEGRLVCYPGQKLDRQRREN
jgi:TM2 domain-containing membrane protein YozV